MYQYPFQLNSKKILIKPYTTETEKDLLIMSSFEIYDMDEILRVLGLEENLIQELTENEKKVLLYKYREISIGDEITMKFKCSHCKQPNEGIIECKNFIEDEEINHKYKQLDEIPNDENLHLFVNMTEEELENLDLDEYENLLKDVENSQIKYNFTKSCKCIKCKKDNVFDISNIKYILESLSEDTIMSIYRTYNDMCMFGNYNKKDIDSLYPFERIILIGLINKTREDMKTK